MDISAWEPEEALQQLWFSQDNQISRSNFLDSIVTHLTNVAGLLILIVVSVVKLWPCTDCKSSSVWKSKIHYLHNTHVFTNTVLKEDYSNLLKCRKMIVSVCECMRGNDVVCRPVARKFCWAVLLKKKWTFSYCSTVQE